MVGLAKLTRWNIGFELGFEHSSGHGATGRVGLANQENGKGRWGPRICVGPSLPAR